MNFSRDVALGAEMSCFVRRTLEILSHPWPFSRVQEWLLREAWSEIIDSTDGGRSTRKCGQNLFHPHLPLTLVCLRSLVSWTRARAANHAPSSESRDCALGSIRDGIICAFTTTLSKPNATH